MVHSVNDLGYGLRIKARMEFMVLVLSASWVYFQSIHHE